MIRVSNVRKVYPTRFGNKVVLDGVDLTLAKGEKLGILGRNGAGKSTLIRLISGAEKATSGTVERHMSVSWPLAFGGAFQHMLTGRDNLRFISGIYKQDFEKNLAFVEEFAELGPYLREPIRTYSSGMRARLAFAISMIIEFDCFLIDEIASVGDARFHDKCNFELFEKRNDRAMVIISHDPAYVRDHCNRWAVLHEGKLVHYDDFEVAHSTFRELIGARDRAARVAAIAESGLTIRNRLHLLEVSHRAAAEDDRFRALVEHADGIREKAELTRAPQDWHAAEQGYADALRLYPYQRSYWVVHGHAIKEQGDLAGAEISYRTACANGEPAQDVGVHLSFALEQQGVDEGQFPVRSIRRGPLSGQLPGKPDIVLLSRIVWRTGEVSDAEILALLRAHGSFDELMAAMIADDRFVPPHASGARLAAGQAGKDRGSDLGSDLGSDRDGDWLALAICIFLPGLRAGERQDLVRQLGDGASFLGHLLSLDTFVDWPLTRASLEERAEVA